MEEFWGIKWPFWGGKIVPLWSECDQIKCLGSLISLSFRLIINWRKISSERWHKPAVDKWLNHSNKQREEEANSWLRSSSLVDYISGSTFKWASDLLGLNRGSIYIEKTPDWSCSQALLVTDNINLSLSVFQCLSLRSIPPSDGRAMLKTKLPLSLWSRTQILLMSLWMNFMVFIMLNLNHW